MAGSPARPVFKGVEMYVLDGSRNELASEFLEQPYGIHSPELKAALDLLRLVNPNGKMILVCTVPGREWVLAELQGSPPRAALRHDYTFNDLADAERAIFKLRWRLLTGVDLEESLQSPK
jgi:hypothetical protein